MLAPISKQVDTFKDPLQFTVYSVWTFGGPGIKKGMVEVVEDGAWEFTWMTDWNGNAEQSVYKKRQRRLNLLKKLRFVSVWTKMLHNF